MKPIIKTPLRSGYASMLALLIVVAIGMIICYLKFNPQPASYGTNIKTREKIQTPPWIEWSKLAKKHEKGQLKALSADQIYWQDALEFELDASENAGSRGSLELLITQDGISGIWKGTFYLEDKTERQVMESQYAGYWMPEKSDESSENRDKLYFVCKGKFSILDTDYTNNKVSNLTGDIYVSGSLDKNKTLTGSIFLTTDSASYIEYKFQGTANRKDR